MAMERWGRFGSTDRWEPFRLVDMQSEVNRLFDTVLGRPATAAAPSGRAWLPAVDMHETPNDLVLKVEVPGVRDKDVMVSITGDLLTIKGERRWAEEEGRDQKLLHVERAYGQFERMIQLPLAVQGDKVKATYRDGVLEITLPKAEELKPREIKIDIL